MPSLFFYQYRRAALLMTALLSVVMMFIVGCQSAPASDSNVSTASSEDSKTLVIYSGRNENLVGPLLERFETETGIETEVQQMCFMVKMLGRWAHFQMQDVAHHYPLR